MDAVTKPRPVLIGLARLFLWNAKLDLARAMHYRTDFVLSLVLSLGFSAIGPVVQYLIFSQTNGYPGWTLNEIILFQGVVLLGVGLKEMMFGQISNVVMNLVWKGDFDRLLLKPYPSIGILLSSGFYSYGAGSLLAGSLVIGFAIQHLHLHVAWWQWGMFIFFVAAGLLLYMSILVFYCATVIVLVHNRRFWEMLTNLLRFSDYPLDIYPNVMRAVFLTFLPFAVWNYAPSQVLLGRLDDVVWLAAAGAGLLFWISLRFWNMCLHKYTSAGG